MLPIKLLLENFYCYSKSEIDFTQFQTAVIVGRINENEKKSNGAGKSTIFAAIKYVLFNEVETSSLDKVIQHNSNYCRVSFEFQSHLDQQVYKIIRSRSRKAGTDVRLFRKIGNDWEDLTQRKTTDTESEIFKLIKINYRTFSNSVLFAQGDLSGIPAMTPSQRKMALKEALQLSVYSKYEATAKKKIADLVKEIDKNKTIISTLGDPEQELKKLNDNLASIKNSIKNFQTIHQEKIESFKIDQECLLAYQNQLNGLLSQNKDQQEKYAQCNQEHTFLLNEQNGLRAKIGEYGSKIKQSKSKIETLNGFIGQWQNLSEETFNLKTNQYNSVRDQLFECQTEYKTLTSTLNELLVPLSDGDVCKHCRQVILPEARQNCKLEIEQQIQTIREKLQLISNRGKELQKQEANGKSALQQLQKNFSALKESQSNLKIEENKLFNEQETQKEFEKLYVKNIEDASDKAVLLTKLSPSNVNEGQIDNLNDQIRHYQAKISINEKEINNGRIQLESLAKQEVIIVYEINKTREYASKLTALKEQSIQLEAQYSLHQKVLTSFGASGIPALIIHTILDDLQIEANNYLFQLRPGLQLQFKIEKERDKDGETVDTLEIIYHLNDAQLEYSQLSGAQKLVVALSLRLGLLGVIGKRLGTDMKMLLIDEADQSLDEASLETFEEAIKHLAKDYKILVITHNNELKTKFSSVILVEQDQYLNSTVKLMNGG